MGEFVMDVGALPDLQNKITKVCEDLLSNNKLITTKSVLAKLFESSTGPIDIGLEDYIAKIINNWRLSKIIKPASTTKNYKKKLIKANREIQFLKAKIKALNSFYNRQRQELIMRIEGMLYK